MGKELGMVLFHPFEQGTAVVQTNSNTRVAKQTLDERQIGTLIGLFENRLEVADRLVTVDQEN